MLTSHHPMVAIRQKRPAQGGLVGLIRGGQVAVAADPAAGRAHPNFRVHT